jgi:hypothetical protein
MGAWGTDPFDNDNAADFSGELEHCSDAGARNDLLLATLGAVLTDYKWLPGVMEPGYELPHYAERAIASAAYVADTLRGDHHFGETAYAKGYDRPTDSYYHLDFPPVSPELRSRAVAALERVLEVMVRDGIEPEWQAATRELLEILR